MMISEAQLEIRARFVGGFYGQLVAGTLWLTAAGLAVWRGPRASIIILVGGGCLIFPATELLIVSEKTADGSRPKDTGREVASGV